MARKRIGSDEEKLDDNSLERVIKYLSEKGATKKVACQMLNISYNTARLDKLIENYKTKKEQDAKRRAEKRGKPATPAEIDYVISEYLSGATFDKISKALFRGPVFIRSILEAYAIPERDTSTDYRHPRLIPEEAVRTEFALNEVVWSARYNSLAKIISEIPHPQEKVYRIWLKDENWMQFACQPASELASLEKLKNMGIKL